MDLDPDEALPWNTLVEGTLLTKKLLDTLGLQSFLKTTGGKGLHVVVPLTADKKTPDWDAAKMFAREVCRRLSDEQPERYVLNMAKKERTGRIFLDYLRNDRTSTAVAPLSPRARDGAPVSMPIEWSRVKAGLDPMRYTLRTAPALLKKEKPWRNYAKAGRSLRSAIETLVNSEE
jgi:bifunctional non-homologous end joining protein LigD